MRGGQGVPQLPKPKRPRPYPDKTVLIGKVDPQTWKAYRKYLSEPGSAPFDMNKVIRDRRRHKRVMAALKK